MAETDINKMDFKALRKEVLRLRDDLARMKRGYEDILYNLDNENFSKSILLEKDKMKAQIQITAEKIKSTVSNESLENTLLNYSTITQTANDIAFAVAAEREYTTDLLGSEYMTSSEVISQINLSSENIFLSVKEEFETKSDAEERKSELESRIELNESDISLIVSKNIAAYFESEDKPTASMTDEEKAMLCLYDGEYYYYSDKDERWKKYPASGLKTMFCQTVDGFSLTGDVTIDGSLVTNISTVNDILYLGSVGDAKEKSIMFSTGANISTYNDGFSPPTGIIISASTLNLATCSHIEWGNNAPVAVFG